MTDRDLYIRLRANRHTPELEAAFREFAACELSFEGGELLRVEVSEMKPEACFHYLAVGRIKEG